MLSHACGLPTLPQVPEPPSPNVALPLAAVLVLGATPTEMGLLAAAGSLPNLLFGLVAGVWIDRVPRKPILIWADIGRSLLLVTIPVAAWLSQLSFLHIWVVTFAAGTLTVFFQIAAISVLPALVEKRQLVEANSRLSTSEAVISIAGPAAAGGLVQLFSAPRVILVDAVSYLLSALALAGVAEEEPQSAAQADRVDAPETANGIRGAVASIVSEVGEGVYELLRTPLLRTLTITSSLGMLAGAISAAVQMLFLVNQLDFTPSIIGIVAACGGIGSLAGAMLAGKRSATSASWKDAHLGQTVMDRGYFTAGNRRPDRPRSGFCWRCAGAGRSGQHALLRQSAQFAAGDYLCSTAGPCNSPRAASSSSAWQPSVLSSAEPWESQSGCEQLFLSGPQPLLWSWPCFCSQRSGRREID